MNGSSRWRISTDELIHVAAGALKVAAAFGTAFATGFGQKLDQTGPGTDWKHSLLVAAFAGLAYAAIDFGHKLGSDTRGK